MARNSRCGKSVNGILLLDKPLGLSSNKALQTVKHLLQAKKAGHTGSLDPLASGMLPLCFGEATKVSAFLLDADKEYITQAHLGIKTSTGDLEGQVTASRPVPSLSKDQVLEVLRRFTGAITQIPPMHSAIKKEGKPLYKLARKGREVERPARPVVIHDLTLLQQDDDILTLRVRCSKGTYIRSLVEDIGEALSCGAHVRQLRRTGVEPFKTQAIYGLEELRKKAQEESPESLKQYLLPSDLALRQFEALQIDEKQENGFRAGRLQRLSDLPQQLKGEQVRVYGPNERFAGLGIIGDNCELQPKRVFND